MAEKTCNQRDVMRALRAKADPQRAKFLQGFFKTGKGQYAEGDVLLGLTVPMVRKIAREHRHLPVGQVLTLLHSKFHEARQVALFILVAQFEAGDETLRKEIYELYLDNTRWINNWDLVDGSAHQIVGGWLWDRSRKPLLRLARSNLIWERRIAIIATFKFIKHGELDDTYSIADQLRHDDHDLIHKAVGWMLREAGKREVARLEGWLKDRYADMPRTMLRYAIEKLPKSRRRAYLEGRV